MFPSSWEMKYRNLEGYYLPPQHHLLPASHLVSKYLLNAYCVPELIRLWRYKSE